ncbi:MAG: LD-carboxypeptidase [Bacilli bacterium]
MKVNKLKPGDTIGFLIPSSKFNMDDSRIKNLEKYLNDFGLKIKYGKTCSSSYGYLAGTDQERISDIEEMFSDPNISAIVCMKGGYGAGRIVDKIDYEIIKNNPKLFIGFSDITIFLNCIYQKTSIPTIHGLVGIFLGHPNIDSFSVNDFKTLLFENTKGRILKNPNDNCKTLVGGVSEGVLVGGNIMLVTNLIGSDYDIDMTDKILFLEEVNEKPYSIDRMLCQLRLSKRFEQLKGIIFGHFTNCTNEEGFTTDEVIEQYCQDLKIPVITHFASGHEFPFINLPIGVKVRLDADNKNIEILEEIYN